MSLWTENGQSLRKRDCPFGQVYLIFLIMLDFTEANYDSSLLHLGGAVSGASWVFQGIQLSHSTGQNQHDNYLISNILFNADKGIEPSLRRAGGSWLTSRTVEPAPPSRGPASRIKSADAATAGSRSAIREQPICPEILALVAVMGFPTA